MTGSLPLKEIAAVQARLAWMREARIWPNGLRYLWTDAFGVVLLVSLWQERHDDRLLRECEWVVAEVITHIMACTSHFPGRFLRPAVP
jgi:hypothetical protein